jgi:hypothetical protein
LSPMPSQKTRIFYLWVGLIEFDGTGRTIDLLRNKNGGETRLYRFSGSV